MAGNKWQISDELWEKMAPLLPEHKTHHPLGTHRRRVNNRAAMNAILFVLRTGCQWNARHCCKVSDEAAFCLIQRPYISKTLLTRRISPRGSP